MPELPEVEIVRRGLEPAWLGKTIEHASVRRRDLRMPVPEGFESALEGRRVARTQRRGKYILVFLDNGEGFSLHLGMSGRVLIIEDGASYLPQKHDHILWHMADGTGIVFSDPRRFGMAFLIGEDSWQSHKAFAAMGPEPLGNDFHASYMQKALNGRRSAIKTALLDQRLVTGIGNIYACEALHMAGIHPQRAAGDLNESECESLIRAVRNVLKAAIESGGSTLRDYQHTDGGLGYFQHSFAVYGREGEPCRQCHCSGRAGRAIKRIVQAGRSTFFCDICQK